VKAHCFISREALCAFQSDNLVPKSQDAFNGIYEPLRLTYVGGQLSLHKKVPGITRRLDAPIEGVFTNPRTIQQYLTTLSTNTLKVFTNAMRSRESNWQDGSRDISSIVRHCQAIQDAKSHNHEPDVTCYSAIAEWLCSDGSKSELAFASDLVEEADEKLLMVLRAGVQGDYPLSWDSLFEIRMSKVMGRNDQGEQLFLALAANFDMARG